MGLFGNSNQTGQSLMPSGLGGGPTDAQKQLFAQAANDSGLTQMGMGMLDQATGGMNMKNEDQVQLLYHLMAAHPNQVALFFLHYPNFMKEFATLISMIVKKEMYAFFNTDMIPQVRVNPEVGAELGYSTLTDENIDLQIGKVVPLNELQMEVNQADMRANSMMGGHQQQMMQQQYQQQMMHQQQQQQMMMQQPQRQGMGGALAGFGSSLIRGSLGLPPAQQQPPMGYPQQGMPQQPQY